MKDSQSRRSSEVPLLDLKAQYVSIRDEVHAAIERVVESQRFILGAEVEGLEQEIASYSNCRFGIGVSSGTDALIVSLMAIGIEPGDEVITTPYTFFATAGSIARLGAIPIFLDIDPLTFNINVKELDRVITERTKAIIPVHLYGQTADMDPLMETAERAGLFVIEDAAQAIGADYKGRRAGSMGHLGCFSFFPSKNLGGFGDSGMITTNDKLLAEKAKLLRNHGFQPKYYNRIVGGNFRMDAIQAAILRIKLKYLDQWTRARISNAEKYRHRFIKKGLTIEPEAVPCFQEGCWSGGKPEECGLLKSPGSGLVLPFKSSENRHIYNQFVIRARNRDRLKAHMEEKHIGCEIYYPVPLHLQECFNYLGHKQGKFPSSECAAGQTLALPIYPELSEEMLDTVVDVVEDFLSYG